MEPGARPQVRTWCSSVGSISRGLRGEKMGSSDDYDPGVDRSELGNAVISAEVCPCFDPINYQRASPFSA